VDGLDNVVLCPFDLAACFGDDDFGKLTQIKGREESQPAAGSVGR